MGKVMISMERAFAQSILADAEDAKVIILNEVINGIEDDNPCLLSVIIASY